MAPIFFKLVHGGTVNAMHIPMMISNSLSRRSVSRGYGSAVCTEHLKRDDPGWRGGPCISAREQMNRQIDPTVHFSRILFKSVPRHDQVSLVHTEYYFAAVEDANHLVSRCPVVSDFE